MAITYVGGATASSAGNTDVSVSLTALTGGSDSAPSAGDLVIFAYNIADADNADLNMACNTTGFDTNEVADLFGNGTQDANLGVYWKFMTATPDTAVVGEGSLGGTDTAIQGVAMVFRGVATVAQGGPFDTTATTDQGTTGGLPDPPSINTSGAAGICTVIVGSNAHAAGSGGAFTAPANYTTDFLTIGNVDDTADGIIGMGYNLSPSDPEDPGAFADNVAATGWCAVTMALKPAPAAQSVTNGTVASGSQLFAATVAYKVVTTALASGLSLFAPTVVAEQAVTSGTIAAGTVVSAPAVKYAVVAPSLVSTLTLNAPTVAYAVAPPAKESGLVMSAPSVATGPVTVVNGTRGTAVVLNPPAVSPGAVTVTGGTYGATTLGAPAVSQGGVLGATIPGGSTLSAPTVTQAAPTIAAGTVSGTVLHAPSIHTAVNSFVQGVPSLGPAGFVGSSRRGRWGPY